MPVLEFSTARRRDVPPHGHGSLTQKRHVRWCWLNSDRETTGAGKGNRTLIFSLENCCSTIELYPHCRRWLNTGWEELERVKGIEPSYSAWKSADFPCICIGHSDISQFIGRLRSLENFSQSEHQPGGRGTSRNWEVVVSAQRRPTLRAEV